MSNYPKRHHYVPQFYLQRFADEGGRLWAWDKKNDRIFRTRPSRIAAERHFYRIPELAEAGLDPSAMEKQFAEIEHEVSIITDQWIGWLLGAEHGTKIEIPTINRHIISQYVALQIMRTAETREILSLLDGAPQPEIAPSDEYKRQLHTHFLWDQETVTYCTERIETSIWIFARNDSDVGLVTSDNPIVFRTANNRMWIKTGMFANGAYANYPLSPDIMMYCYEAEYWSALAKFDCYLSPVVLTKQMVSDENTGQTFSATRFVLSDSDDFDAVRKFAGSIGTDKYAPKP